MPQWKSRVILGIHRNEKDSSDFESIMYCDFNKLYRKKLLVF